jgi:hypothetical protein
MATSREAHWGQGGSLPREIQSPVHAYSPQLLAGSEQRERAFVKGAVRLTGVKGLSAACEILTRLHDRTLAGSEQRERAFVNGAVRLTGVKGVSPPCQKL